MNTRRIPLLIAIVAAALGLAAFYLSAHARVETQNFASQQIASLQIASLPPAFPLAGISSSAAITPPLPVIIEEPLLSPTYKTCSDSYWYSFQNERGHAAYLTLNVSDIKPSNSGEWRPELPEPGFYKVEAYIAGHAPITWCTGSGRTIAHDTQDAHYEIHHAAGSSEIIRSQYPLSNAWLDLGSFPFSAGNSGYVYLSDLNDEENFTNTVSFSAMRFTYQGPSYHAYLPGVTNPQPTSVPPLAVQAMHAPGFDTCDAPALSTLATWWKSSPYHIVNLYIGGVSRYSGCPNLRLDDNYVATARNQGWSFIPTWVGPQAPCTNYKNRISYDIAEARQQGFSQADQAAQTAAGLGLTTAGLGGTIIYYDMESYAPSGSGTASRECKDAVNAFIDGWTERLHQLGNRAGAYGSGCSSYAYEWADPARVPHPIDNFWAASYYSPPYYYNPNASVFGVSCVSDSLWANQRRIRQYNGDHSEDWGGKSLVIDSDIADGEVALSRFPGPVVTDAVSLPAEPGPDRSDSNGPASSDSNGPAIQDMGWLNAQQGWLLAGARLWRTEDGGLTWQDISPVVSAVETGTACCGQDGTIAAPLLSAFFLDPQTGWALSPYRSKDLVGFRLHASRDGGRTWQATFLAAPLASHQALQLHFFNLQHAALLLRRQTGSNFQQGLLLVTSDGGQSWQSSETPAAAPIFWLDGQRGWLAGGPSGKELYHTPDGGRTWQPVSLPEKLQDPVAEFSLSRPTVIDGERLLLPVAYSGEEASAWLLYTSLLGAARWDLSPRWSLEAASPGPAPTLPGALNSPAGLLPGESIARLELTASPLGWMQTQQAICQGEKGRDLTCRQSTRLWRTLDGGQSWLLLALPFEHPAQ